MRIAAGVFLLIAAVFNGCAGITWLGAGGVSAAVGKAAENPDSLKAEDGTKIELTAETKEAAADMKSKGGNWMMLAIFVLVVMGLQIGGGVVLFMNKAATFVLIVGVLGIGAEVWGGLNSAFGIANAPGIVASILAIVAALGMKKSAGTPAA